MVALGFMVFCIKFCGVAVRVQKVAMTFVCNSQRLMDEESVLYLLHSFALIVQAKRLILHLMQK